MATNLKEIAPEVMQATPEHQRPESLPAKENPLDVLRPREKQILVLMAQGFSNKTIAEKLVLSQKSVENYINGIFPKIGISSEDTEVDTRVASVLLYQKNTPDFKNPAEDYFGDNELAPLTSRQKDIVSFIGKGYSNLAIASGLGLSIKTIENYIHTILDEKIPVDPQKYDPRVVLTLISQTGVYFI